jgi:hypothetical protein
MQKGIITIVWNPTGFQGIRILPSGCKFNNRYHIQENEIFGPLLEGQNEQPGAASRKMIVHADKARPHTAATSQKLMQENGMIRGPHSAHSPDLAPSDGR